MMVENVVGGRIGEKTPEEIQELYERLGATPQQRARVRRAVTNEVSAWDDAATTQLAEPTRQVKALSAMVNGREICVLCEEVGHEAYVCHVALEMTPKEEEAQYMNVYYQRPKNDPYSNT